MHYFGISSNIMSLGGIAIAIGVLVDAGIVIRGRLHREESNPVMWILRAVYAPVLRFALRHRVLTLASAALLFGFAVFLAGSIGSEFMPPLDEETAMWMPVTDPSISLSKATELLREQDRIISQDPAVASVVGKIGRAETSTDPAPINMTVTIVSFKPKDQWLPGLSQDAINHRLDEKLRMPGVTNIWTQPIRNRIDMLSTGIRTQVGIKVFGSDLETIEKKSIEIERVLHQVPGAADLYAERITGAPYLEMHIDRTAAARYGINVGDAQDVIESAIGGERVTLFNERPARFPVRVRYARDFR